MRNSTAWRQREQRVALRNEVEPSGATKGRSHAAKLVPTACPEPQLVLLCNRKCGHVQRADLERFLRAPPRAA